VIQVHCRCYQISLVTSVPSKVHKYAELPEHLRSEISFLRTCNILNLISHSPVETFHWLCVYMDVKLHAH